MRVTKPIASLSLDLDNKWSYLKTHGDAGWDSFPTYLDVIVPRVLKVLQEQRLTITFFVVGQDAALPVNREPFQALAAAGHEIGNHSFHHEPWMHLHAAQDIEREILIAEKHIERVTGQRPLGFRGPGFSLSLATLRTLKRRGYLYDASTWPTFLIPLARAYYFMTAKFTPEEKRLRQALGGTFRSGFQPIKPYRWQVDGGTLLEIPVTTLPFLKVPIHASYLVCLALVSRRLALEYFAWSLRLCRMTGTPPSLLLHPTDFLGCDDTTDLAFFPGMSWPSEKKVELVSEFLQVLSRGFEVVTLREQAQRLALTTSLPLVKPAFPGPTGTEQLEPRKSYRQAG